MAPTLYYILGGPPSRAVLLTIRNCDLNVELKSVDMFAGEHLTEEMLKINPSHTVPFLKEGDFVVCESRAIAQYLVESQQPESQVLGRFAKKRALINQFLQMDQGKIFPAVAGLYVPVFRKLSTLITEEQKQKVVEAIESLDKYIKKGFWVAGAQVSIADFSLLASISTAVALGFNLDKYENVNDWYNRGKSLKGWEENEEGAKGLASFLNSKLTEPLEW